MKKLKTTEKINIINIAVILVLVYFVANLKHDNTKLTAELTEALKSKSVTIAKCSVQAGKYDSLLTEAKFKLNVCDGIIEAHRDSVGIGE